MGQRSHGFMETEWKKLVAVKLDTLRKSHIISRVKTIRHERIKKKHKSKGNHNGISLKTINLAW